MSSKGKNREKRPSQKADRIVRDKQATERSLKRVSELYLNPEEEDSLIKLLAELENVVVDDSKKSKRAELELNETRVLDDGTQVMSKSSFARKLMRDDRRSRKAASSGSNISAEKIAARIRRTIVITHRNEQLMLEAARSNSQTNSVSRISASSEIIIAMAKEPERPTSTTGARKDIMALSSSVRVYFELDKSGVVAQQISSTERIKESSTATDVKNDKKSKKGGGNSGSGDKGKLVVLQRAQLTISDLLTQMRAKFNVGSKYNAIVVKAKQQFLSEEVDLYKLMDDDVLQLSMIPKALASRSESSAIKSHAKKATKLLADELLYQGGPAGAFEETQLSGAMLQVSVQEDDSVQLEGESEEIRVVADGNSTMKVIPDDEMDREESDEDVNDDAESSKWDAAKFAQLYRERFMHPLTATASIVPDATKNRQLQDDLQHIHASKRYQQSGIAAQRASLPIFALRETILAAVSNSGVDSSVSVSSPHPQVLLVCGETGSGKTTQVPQFLLENAILSGLGSTVNIVVTQPRRIAAISVAERVAYEMTAQENILDRYDKNVDDNEEFGTSSNSAKLMTATQSLVGYQVRLEARVHSGTRLLFCTTGLLLRRLQSPDFWTSVSHIVVDEIHERNVETDFLLTILKQELPRYPHIRLVLMSATMQEQTFRLYFHQCPIIYVPGRTFPVASHYPQEIQEMLRNQFGQKAIAKYQLRLLPPAVIGAASTGFGKKSKHSGESVHGRQSNDASSSPAVNITPVIAPFFEADLITDLICAIMQRFRQIPQEIAQSKRGQAILVFMSGIQSIEKLHKSLKYRLSSNNSSPPILCVLHGTMAPEQQRQAFRRTVPGQWKIVLATNIAETSITVDDVVHVIDTGLVKEQRYHAVSGLSILEEVHIARCNATQRAGRAGRVQAGHVWRLYDEEFMLPTVNNSATRPTGMQEFPLPEMQRIALEDVILQVLLLQLGRPEEFLSRCLQPPSLAQLRAAMATLIEVKAVLPEPTLPLTALGYHLAHLPVDVRIGKMLVYASLLQVTESALTVAAYLSCRSSPFLSPLAQRDIARRVHSTSYLGKYRPVSSFQRKDDKKAGVTAMAAADEAEAGKSDSTIGDSDHLAVVRAYNHWRHVLQTQGDSAAYAFCRQQFLSMQKLQEIHKLRALYLRHLVRAGLVPASSSLSSKSNTEAPQVRKASAAVATVLAEEDEFEIDDDADEGEDLDVDREEGLSVHKQESSEIIPMDAEEEEMLLRCALCAGFAPNIIRAVDVVVGGKRAGGKFGKLVLTKRLTLVQADQKEVKLHPSSLLCGKFATIVPETAQDAFLIYYQKTAVGAGVNSHAHSSNSNSSFPSANRLDASPQITTINVFDATVVPHPAILLFAGNDIDLMKSHSSSSATGKRHSRQQQRCVRVQIGGWIEMELSELHLAFYRRVQREIEDLFRRQVEASLTSHRLSRTQQSDNLYQRLYLLRLAVNLLIRSFIPEVEDDTIVEEDVFSEDDDSSN